MILLTSMWILGSLILAAIVLVVTYFLLRNERGSKRRPIWKALAMMAVWVAYVVGIGALCILLAAYSDIPTKY